ncbi:MAG: HlyD family efflux transporter periplasmic adaptor subunit, partial [Frisingicoccus sp.]|uniref:HlyD family efflux transporter periplasmic adaptor subunit n=1 Tax=Frisingicoccus sp. TaxID=1918627 RepID=UPI002636F1F1
MAKNNLTNIQLYQKKKKINIGLILFGVIFIYLIITILAYITSKHVSIYEVREGSILKDTSFTGIIIRDEEVIKSDSEGYINYFITEG